MFSILVTAIIVFIGFLLSQQATMPVWLISYTVMSVLIIKYAELNLFGYGLLFVGYGALLLGLIKPIRQSMLTSRLFRKAAKAMPTMSATERQAIHAGSVGFEAELFTGVLNESCLRQTIKPMLSQDEQTFLQGPVRTLCRMVDDWDITHNRTDMPSEIWTFLKEQGFLGLLIPKQYGGLEFSARGIMSVLAILYGRSITVATTVAVPNSLGPAELLLKYGTNEQKSHYLPRLAKGEEIPCFALTGPNAGSDAASITDTGVVCYDVINGEQVLGIRLNWDKRYITLCPVATVIGLAFRLFDPENLLKKGYDVGISCALIPANTPGVQKGRRHFPLNTAFLNGPTQGKDVFVSLDWLIGGPQMAGQGWRMLMECLSAGRAISLPSSASGGAQAVAMATGAYARIRRQFNQPIANFEGIEEALARIAGKTYMIHAALDMTVTAIDEGVKSSVAGAIVKYHTTQWAREIAIDAMDIHGGKGICLGPNNYLGRGYQGAPISITVEGANILTRSLIIFGQGAIRCHPYVLREMESIQKNDLTSFDVALWGHVSFALSNVIRSVAYSWTDARLTSTPSKITKRYYQMLRRYSTHLAVLTDFSMMMLGAKLKRKEMISARLGDMLSYLYVAASVLRRFELDGERDEDLPLLNWCCQYLFYKCEAAMEATIVNFPTHYVGHLFLKAVLQPFGRVRVRPNDKLSQSLATLLTTPCDARARLTSLVFSEATEHCPLGRLEEAFHKVISVELLEKKIIKAAYEHKFQSLSFLGQVREAETKGIINKDELLQLEQAEHARQLAIKVDDFNSSELSRIIVNSSVASLKPQSHDESRMVEF